MAIVPGVALLAMLAVGPAAAQALTPQEVFRRVAPSVVVIEIGDTSGSGVVIPSREKDTAVVVTNCHVVEKAGGAFFKLTADGIDGLGFVAEKDFDRDLCIVHASFHDTDATGKRVLKKLPAVQIGSSQWLEVGDPVYAVGAPQGLELSLSNGLVSGFRQHKGNEYIQTTAPISKGSSGGGLFDAQGRLVGITTMYVKDGQALNFAVPAELIASVPKVKQREVQPASYEPEPKPSPQRDRWLWVSESVDGDNLFIDTHTAQQDGTDVTVWVKTVLPKPETDKVGDTYDETLSLQTYHCTSRQVTVKAISQYSRGRSIYSMETPSYRLKRESVMPGTVREALYEAACEP